MRSQSIEELCLFALDKYLSNHKIHKYMLYYYPVKSLIVEIKQIPLSPSLEKGELGGF